MRTLIIGIGNPVRSDDGIGWRIVEELSHEVQRHDIQMVATQQLTPELSEAASRADRVLFIDAAHNGEPGTLRCRRIFPDLQSAHSHSHTPPALLGLAKTLYGHCPEACLITMVAESFAHGESLSAPVLAALPELRARVNALVVLEKWENWKES